jgi:8-oxo-dGTP pyrophosphatase MutT (NUDIX family)
MTEPKPWKLLSERSAKDYTIFRTRTLDVADPRTEQSYIRTIIQAPDWVNVVALTRDEKVILVRQFRFGTWSTTLEIPGGMVDPGEEAATAAARELEEETGFRAERMTCIGVSHPNPAIFDNRLHSYLALGCTPLHGGRPDASEDLRVELAARDELRDLVKRGEVTHALVLAALLYASWSD